MRTEREKRAEAAVEEFGCLYRKAMAEGSGELMRRYAEAYAVASCELRAAYAARRDCVCGMYHVGYLGEGGSVHGDCFCTDSSGRRIEPKAGAR